VRCALEENNSGDIRYDKLCRLIDECDYSIHDLSHVELGPAGLPRFNMPFELGLYLGACRFGGRRHRRKTALIMVGEPFVLPVYLSDVGGNDPHAHHSDPIEVVRIVRRYLKERPDGTPLPGATQMRDAFQRFQSALPSLAEELQLAVHECDPFRDYVDYVNLVNQFLQQV
jgi:hypothetical protein